MVIPEQVCWAQQKVIVKWTFKLVWPTGIHKGTSDPIVISESFERRGGFVGGCSGKWAGDRGGNLGGWGITNPFCMLIQCSQAQSVIHFKWTEGWK